MGEWSEYFEEFPQENPANWINGRFDPEGAHRARQQAEGHAQSQAQLNETIQKLIEEGDQRALEKQAKA